MRPRSPTLHPRRLAHARIWAFRSRPEPVRRPYVKLTKGVPAQANLTWNRAITLRKMELQGQQT
jgi:hypothetical protein